MISNSNQYTMITILADVNYTILKKLRQNINTRPNSFMCTNIMVEV